MSRKVWTISMDEPWYANLYIFLVGAPATGKTIAMLAAKSLVWDELKDYHVAHKSLTAAALSDTLNDAVVKILRPASTPPYIEFNSLIINSPELGVFMSQYDRDIIQRMTDAYDNGSWEERRRGNKLEIKIPRVQINFLAACTPSFLGEVLPIGAWDQGFMSRVIMIFSGETVRKSFFRTEAVQESLGHALTADAKTISSLYGKMEWTPEAAAAMQAWEDEGGPPAPDHVRLIHYLGRRSANMLKLSMVASISRSNELIIRHEDFVQALSWLLEAEEQMPEIFKAMRGATADGSAIDETWYFVWQASTKEKRPVSEARIIRFLQQRVPNYSVMRIIDLMCRSGMLKQVDYDSKLGNQYLPAKKDSDIS